MAGLKRLSIAQPLAAGKGGGAALLAIQPIRRWCSQRSMDTPTTAATSHVLTLPCGKPQKLVPAINL